MTNPKASLRIQTLGDHSRAVKVLRSLRRSKGRRQERRFLVEGPKVIEAALAERHPLDGLYFSGDASAKEDNQLLVRQAVRCGVPLFSLSAQIIRGLSDVPSPQGVLAVARMPDEAGGLNDFCDGKNFLTVLEGVQDPGNIGAIIRTARAAGVSGLVFCGGCADPYSAKAVRGSAGAVFGLPLFSGAGKDEISVALARGKYRVYGAVPLGGKAPWEVSFERPAAFLVGAEGSGLSGELSVLCQQMVTIPMAGKVESFNVAVAFGIIAVEIAKQS